MDKKNVFSLNFLLTVLYFSFLPLEDFIFKGVISSSTRIIGAALIISFLVSNDSKHIRLFIYDWPIFYLILVSLGIIFIASYKDYYAIFRVFNWILLYFVVATIISRNLDKVDLLFKVYLIPVLYISILNIFEFLSKGGIDRSTVKEVDENLLGLSMAIAAIFSIYNIFNKKQLVFYIGALLVFLLGIIASGSRSSMLALFIAILGLIKLNDLRKSFFLFIVLLLISFILFQFPVFTDFILSRFNSVEADKGAGRTLIWSVGFNLIYENWLFGVGYRNFPFEFSKILGFVNLSEMEFSAITLDSNSNRAAHNIYLSTMVELGIFGLISLLVIFYKSIKICLNRSDFPFSRLFLSILIIFIVFSVFIDTQNLKMFWFALSLPLSLSVIQNKSGVI
jgi:O-antigen ligase